MLEQLRQVRAKAYFVNTGIAVAILCLIMFIAWKGAFLPYSPLAIPAWLAYGSWEVLAEARRRARHRKLIHGKRLQWLMPLGFTIENIGDYWGFKGMYRDHFVRVYYNWESNLYRRDEELSILIYFEPPLGKNGKLDTRRLDKINEDLDPGLLTFREYRMNAEASYLINHVPFTLFTSKRKIKRRLDSVIDTVKAKHFVAITEERVHELVKEDPFLHGPDNAYFQIAYGTLVP